MRVLTPPAFACFSLAMKKLSRSRSGAMDEPSVTTSKDLVNENA